MRWRLACRGARWGTPSTPGLSCPASPRSPASPAIWHERWSGCDAGGKPQTQSDAPATGERAVTLGVALIIDQLVGEPPRALHPVVRIGALVTAIERRAPRNSPAAQLVYGAALVGVVVGAAATTALLAEAILGHLPPVPRILLRAALLKPAFAVRDLLAAADRVRVPLETGDIAAARVALRDLVSRDAMSLDAGLVAAAAIESLAENASDSIIGPWLAFLVGGLPGAYAYRAVNTLDAMVGYRGQYEYLGKPAARCDDLLNLVPARLTAALIVAGAAPTRHAQTAWRTMLHDHTATASPNAGWPMAAMAGALRVRLEKIDHYVLGRDYHPPRASDIAAASRFASGLATVAGGGLALVGLCDWRLRRRWDAA
jgi:adenosylcobinamide-phosphate synthase